LNVKQNKDYSMNKRQIYWFALLLTIVVACGDDDGISLDDNSTVGEEMPDEDSPTVFIGTTISFVKENGTDPTAEENQDRITENVWITRGTSGGQIFNAVTETEADQDESPLGTLWAVGTTEDIENLTFEPFRDAVGMPRDNVGVNLVMLLVEDNIAIDVTFTGWTQGNANGGGFSYNRSSME